MRKQLNFFSASHQNKLTGTLSSKELKSTEPPAPPLSHDEKVYSVSALNSLIKGLLEETFPEVFVRGEISNFTAHSSGHFYFSLKDESSQVQAVMFKGSNCHLKFQPKSGLEVLVKARVSVYSPRGSYQLICQTMEPLGDGALRLAFEQLKAKLEKEGLFQKKLKKPLPPWPQHIAVVTSPTGAALRDVLQILKRRSFGLKVTLVPAIVQGEQGVASLIKALSQADSLKADLLICTRGGGSIEDLWCFNEEAVARALRACQTPTISAVGHEIDYTICDFVADLRAPTPSAAAELAVKDRKDIEHKVQELRRQLKQKITQSLKNVKENLQHHFKQLCDPRSMIEDKFLRCDELVHRLKLSQKRLLQEKKEHRNSLELRLANPAEAVAKSQLKRAEFHQRMKKTMGFLLKEQRSFLHHHMQSLNNLSPLNVLKRGYSLTYKDQKIIRTSDELKPNDAIRIQWAKGQAEAVIKKIKKHGHSLKNKKKEA